MSTPPPSALAAASADTALPYGQPVRRRVAVPLLLAAGLAVGLALLILHDHIAYYRVDSGSMEPTLPIGSRLAVESGLAPKVGEIVAFRAPAGAVPAIPVCGDPGQGTGFAQPCGLATSRTSRAIFVKRIVAGPGATILIRNGYAVVDGIPSIEPFASSCDSAECNFPRAVRVPAGEYYVLGDNRGSSDDSRFWGPIPASSIVGVVVTCAPLQTACHPRR